ncbi:MAG: hypothetical protein AAFP84_03165 [Actinomycetota bacterium]
MRARWAAVGAVVAVTLGAGTIATVDAVTGSGERAIYHSIEPCRLKDTRDEFRVGTAAAMTAGERRTVVARGAQGECPASSLPDDAVSLALNVTAVNASAPTFIQFWGEGDPPTNGSSLNPVPGAAPAPNGVTTVLSSTGTFEMFNLAGRVEVIIDVVGFFADHHHDDRYYTELETRTVATPTFTHVRTDDAGFVEGAGEFRHAGDLGNFSTDGGTVKLTWTTTFLRTVAAGNCSFQLRIDGENAKKSVEPTGMEGRAGDVGVPIPATLVEAFENLNAGNRTIEVWIKNTHDGRCTYNGGNAVNAILVEDFADRRTFVFAAQD